MRTWVKYRGTSNQTVSDCLPSNIENEKVCRKETRLVCLSYLRALDDNGQLFGKLAQISRDKTLSDDKMIEVNW